MRRYLILLAAIVMSFCLGSTYAWSSFVPLLRRLTGLGQGAIQLPFSVFYVAFPLTTIFAGMLLTRLGPRRCAIVGGLLFGGGWMLASLGSRHFGFTILGIGVLGGIGVGFAYIVPISTCILWFPRHKGLITGLSVAGFGGGAALVSYIENHLLSARGVTPFQAFACFGLAFLVLITLAGLVMRVPAASGGATQARAPHWSAALRERPFWLLYFAMFCGLAAGFAVNPNLKQLYQGHAAYSGFDLVAIFALANALGRIAWGLLFDRLESAAAIRANLLLQAAILFGSAWLLRSSLGVQLFALLVAFNYGGVLVVFASTVARRWGPERMGPIYGWLFSANIPAALAPVLAGRTYDRLGSFIVPLSLLGVLLLGASFVIRHKDEPQGPQSPVEALELILPD